MLKLCANLSMLYTEVPFLERFKQAAADGFRGVEYLFPYAYPASEILQRLQDQQLQQVLFNLPAGNWDEGDRGIACDPKRVSEFRAGVERALEYATVLNCQQCNALAGIAPAGLRSTALRKTFVDNLHYAADLMQQSGVKLLIEAINTRDIPGFYLNKSEQAISILDEVGSDNLFYQYDIYHMQVMEGDLANTIQKYLDRIGHMQLADNPGRHEPGSGEINYHFLFQHLQQIGYQGWIGCEYRPLTTTAAGIGWLQDYAQI
ncbi:MAG: hydroxypyruvate isomerase [Gammaproteobacteria bacterium]|nr:hydroxypyruvate isomerase [Gammaproteobacteria bacterium]MBL6999336.1 hydroxypyruvate isomerase [Gammaproteobacteria bacterium]